MRHLPAECLHRLATTIVRAMGSNEGEATTVADHLIRANLCGHDSHGVGMLPDYVRMARAGLLIPNQSLATVVDHQAVLVLDARRGFGQAMAAEAMRRGCARARETGAAVVALRDSCHVGRVGHWAEQCAAEGMASVHFVSVADHDALQAPYGCSDARLGTNPFCAALPGHDGPAVLLDMATSAIAFGKARVARNKGLPVPEGTVIDGAGRPTTDPTGLVDRHEGALLAFGLHKGSGLAVLCELLAGGLSGGQTIAPHHAKHDSIKNNMLSIIVDLGRLGDRHAIATEVDALKAWIKGSPPAPGFAEVLLPGEPERRSFARRSAEGVPLDPKTLADIVAAGEALGLARAALLELIGGVP
jgi:uncharacterized oxidoreductase